MLHSIYGIIIALNFFSMKSPHFVYIVNIQSVMIYIGTNKATNANKKRHMETVYKVEEETIFKPSVLKDMP